MTTLASLIMALITLAILVTCSTRRIGPDDWRLWVLLLSQVVTYATGFVVGHYQ